MNIDQTLRNARAITYSADSDELYADGKLVGSASDLTREIMLARLAAPDEHAEDSDEALFDLIVESI